MQMRVYVCAKRGYTHAGYNADSETTNKLLLEVDKQYKKIMWKNSLKVCGKSLSRI